MQILCAIAGTSILGFLMAGLLFGSPPHRAEVTFPSGPSKLFSLMGFAARRGDVKMMQLLLGADLEHEERWIKVDLSEQRAWVYGRESGLILTTKISSGKRGFRTEPGQFVITDRDRHHVSNIYKDARMSYFRRLSCSAIGIHEGHSPDQSASHGCLRMPAKNAADFWAITKLGDRVVMSP